MLQRIFSRSIGSHLLTIRNLQTWRGMNQRVTCFTTATPAATWKNIPNFSRYQASSDGEIRKQDGKMMKPCTISECLVVHLLNDDNQKKGKTVNRLILSTFDPNPKSDDLVAAHKDGNPVNNKLDNLQWATRSEVSKKRTSRGRDQMRSVPTKVSKFYMENLVDTTICSSVKHATSVVNKFFDKRAIKVCHPGRISVHRDSDNKKKCVIEYLDAKNHEVIVSDVKDEQWKLYNIGLRKQKYFVSNRGRIKVEYCGNCRQKLKSQSILNGYNKVCMSIDGVNKTFFVHRVVAELFVPNPYEYNIIDHIDGDKSNNWAENLQWVRSMSENVQNPATFVKLINQEPVLQIDPENGRVIKEWKNSHVARKSLGYTSNNILACCRGRIKTAYKYRWQFKHSDQE